MAIDKYFKDALDVTIKQFIPIVLASIVGIIGIVVTLGILSMTIAAGIEEMYLKARRGEPVEIMDPFRYTSKFLPLLLAGIAIAIRTVGPPLAVVFLVAMVLPRATSLLLAGPVAIGVVLYVLAASCWYMHVPELIVDKNMGIGEALRVSRETVQTKGGTFMHFILMLLAAVVNALGTLAGGIGVLVTFPLTLGVMAFAYDDECNPAAPVETDHRLEGF